MFVARRQGLVGTLFGSSQLLLEALLASAGKSLASSALLSHVDDYMRRTRPAKFQRYFAKHGRYTAGVETCYGPSLITGEASHQHLAKGVPIGKRFHSARVIRLADAKPMHLGHAVKADGRWRLFAFAGAEDPASETSGIGTLCRFLGQASDSPVIRHTPPGADADAVIDVRAILQQGHRDLDLMSMPGFLLPKKGRHGLVAPASLDLPVFMLRVARVSRGDWRHS